MSRVDTVTVLAGGWSARRYLDRLPGFVIGVNDAALKAPTHAALSMDRLWAENRWAEIQRRAIPTWLRRAPARAGEDPDWLRIFDCDHTSTTLSDEPGTLNGTHSGFCALNLAYQMRPRRIVLVGLDMSKGPRGEAHWFPDYPWAKPGGATTSGKFAEWARQFDTAARQCRDADIAVELWGDSAVPAFRRAKT